ncbi:ELL2 factor, partial [Centropus bengalensis]|nr:ELL2 factor [Centropus bengalensis]
IKIPKANQPNEAHTFNFYVSNVGKDNPQGSFDCVQQMNSSSGESQLTCLGSIQDKITVCATSDSYQTTRERLTQAEEESRNRSAKFIKPGGPFVGKRVQFRKPAPNVADAVPERKRSTPINLAHTIRKPPPPNPVSQRPYKDRVIHLLALKSYKKPELLVRLQRDGVNQKDKNSLGVILQQVAILNTKDNSYSLKEFIFKDVQKDWPGYTEEDKKSLETILSKKLESSQNPTNTSHSESSENSNNEMPTTSSQKRLLSTNFIDPLMRKRQRISHLTNRVQKSVSDPSHKKEFPAPPPPHPSKTTSAPSTSSNPPPLSLSTTHVPTYNPYQTFVSSSLSAPAGRGTQNLPIHSLNQNYSSSHGNQQQKRGCWIPFGMPPPPPPKTTGKKHSVWFQKHKNVKERKKDETKREDTAHCSKEETNVREETAKPKTSTSSDLSEELCFSAGAKETCFFSTDSPSSTSEQPDYMKKYVTIVSQEQRQRYRDDFFAEFAEYRELHSVVEGVTRKFAQFGAQRKLLSPGTKEYEVFNEEVLEEYRKLKEATPNYNEKKCRCEYLHNKLSHIKKLIGDF